jgi:hypothetical protein
MALVKYGSIVTEIKGKVGGQTFQSCRGGFMIKNKGRKSGSIVAIGRDQDVRFSSAVKLWSTLSEAQRDTWKALLGVWTFVNKFGDTYNASAYQIFVTCNINRQLVELAPLLVAPTFDPAEDPMLTYSDFSISGDFEETRSNAAAIGQVGFVQLFRPVAPTISLNKSRLAGSIAREYLATGVTSRKAEAIFLFGGMPQLGSIFYGTSWFCKPDYPNRQFFTIYKINVVA